MHLLSVFGTHPITPLWSDDLNTKVLLAVLGDFGIARGQVDGAQ